MDSISVISSLFIFLGFGDVGKCDNESSYVIMSSLTCGQQNSLTIEGQKYIAKDSSTKLSAFVFLFLSLYYLVSG